MNKNRPVGDIDLKGVSRKYLSGEKYLEVLRDIDLYVKPGQKLAIVGRSGSGKSTLLNLLGTLDRPDEGDITHGGENILSRNDAQVAAWRNSHMGFVFQFHRLLPDFTALENVMIPGLIAGMNEREIREKSEKLIDSIELSHRAKAKPARLSGGEQQRIAIARAMILDPAYILADEPTGNLDSITATNVFSLLLAQCKRVGSALILVTHNRDLLKYMDTSMELAEGKLKPI